MIRQLKTFSDETRLRVLRLCEADDLNVHELTEILDMAQPRVSNHLRLLKEAGLLVDRREGTWVYYRMPPLDLLDPHARRLWEQSKEWMEEEKFHPEDLARREEALRARNAPAEQYFEAIGADWDDIGLQLVDEAMRDRLLLSLVPRNLTVADIGSGSGWFAARLSRLVDEVIAVEPAKSMIETMKRNLDRLGANNVEIRQGTLDALPLKAAETDAVFCNLVLHHTPRPIEALEECFRVLKPGGALTICDFEAHNADWMRAEMADFWLGFHPEKLRGWLEEAGMEQVRINPLGEAQARPRDGGRKSADLTIMAASARKPAATRTRKRGSRKALA